jgi:hypothetical protein
MRSKPGQGERDTQPRRRFTAGQLTTVAVAIAVAVLAFPMGVYAAGSSLVKIVDARHPAHQASVTGGKLGVGDGRGPLTVDGAVRQAAPARPWRAALTTNGQVSAVGPTTATIEVTSLTATRSSGTETVFLQEYILPAGGTDCLLLTGSKVLFEAYAAAGAPVSATFPAPLQVRPPNGRPHCLMVTGNVGTRVSVSGYLG